MPKAAERLIEDYLYGTRTRDWVRAANRIGASFVERKEWVKLRETLEFLRSRKFYQIAKAVEDGAKEEAEFWRANEKLHSSRDRTRRRVKSYRRSSRRR